MILLLTRCDNWGQAAADSTYTCKLLLKKKYTTFANRLTETLLKCLLKRLNVSELTAVTALLNSGFLLSFQNDRLVPEKVVIDDFLKHLKATSQTRRTCGSDVLPMDTWRQEEVVKRCFSLRKFLSGGCTLRLKHVIYRLQLLLLKCFMVRKACLQYFYTNSGFMSCFLLLQSTFSDEKRTLAVWC